MNRILLSVFFVLILTVNGFAATYYVQNGGDDDAAGSEVAPWANCPGMEDWSGSATLSANDTVYFDSGDTWTFNDANNPPFVAVGGVQYIGDTWGDGTRAKFTSAIDMHFGYVSISKDHATYETVFKGFEVDAQSNEGDALIGIGYVVAQTGDLTGATKRVQNCVVHDNDNSTTGDWDYGIIVRATGSYDVANVEILNNQVYNTGEEGISIYSETGGSGYNYDILIRGNVVHDTGQDQSGWADGIILTRGNYNVTVEFNTLYNNNIGILLEPYDSRNLLNIVVRYNITYDNVYGIVAMSSNQLDAYIYGNIIYSNDDYGIALLNTLTNTSNHIYLYNNTIWNVGVTYTDLYVHPSSNYTTLEVKNNIAYPVGISDGGSKITASATNLTTDPNFKNTSNLPTGFSGTYGTNMIPNNDGLSCVAGDAVDQGTDLGGTPYYGAVNISGTNSVNTRDTFTPWDIGAYEYDTGSPLNNPSIHGVSF